MRVAAGQEFQDQGFAGLDVDRDFLTGFQAVEERRRGENAYVGVRLAEFVVLEEDVGIEKIAEERVAFDFVAELFLERGLFVVEVCSGHVGAGTAFDGIVAAEDYFLQLFWPATRRNT